MMMKIKVYVTYANDFDTWNVIQLSDNKCLEYGDILHIERWLIEHKDTHEEVMDYE